VAVDIRSSAFPVEVVVAGGGTVSWSNRDVATHTVTFEDGADSGFLMQNASYSRIFPSAGTFAYRCRVHPFMQASVVVR
jgi:plastocyanin